MSSWHNVGLPVSSAHSVAVSVLASSYRKKADVVENLRVRIDVEVLTVASVSDERSKYQNIIPFKDSLRDWLNCKETIVTWVVIESFFFANRCFLKTNASNFGFCFMSGRTQS